MLHVQIKGSFESFNAKGFEAASWTPNSGKAGEVFGVHECFDTEPDDAQAASVLQNAVLHEVQVLEVQNQFPVPIGVTLSCIPSDESTKTGAKYALTSLPSSHNSTPRVIFRAEQSNSDSIEWRNKYPSYNGNNLEKNGVLEVTGQNYVFVSQNHPVIELLRSNRDKLTSDIDEQPLIDGEWYKITKPVMTQCCQLLRSKVLSKVSTRDMNDFIVQLHRVGAKDWTSMGINDDLHVYAENMFGCQGSGKLDAGKIAKVLTQHFSWSARFLVKYEIHT